MLNYRPRKMRGDYEDITVLVGMVAFVGVLIALMAFVQVSLLKFSGDLTVSQTDIQAVDATHLVKTCMEQGGIITLDFLKKNEDKEICSLCSGLVSCNYKIGAKVDVLEGPKGTFNFGYFSGGSTHKIFVNVDDGGKDYVAALYVSMNS